MSESVPFFLRGYGVAATALSPFARILLALRLRRGKEIAARLPERRGLTRLTRPEGPMIWVHGASVGEFFSVLPLIETIRRRGIRVLVTTGTVTSANIAARRLPPDVTHQFAPLDTPPFVARFLDRWRPDAGLFVESDLWPNLILAARDRKIPLAIVNGRLSEKSMNRWKHYPRTIAALLDSFDLCLAQSQIDASRYSALGAKRVVSTGNLKLDVPAPPADPAMLAGLQDAAANRAVIAAVSTHEGEEDAVIEAHLRLRPAFPHLLTIIAPRHPDRGRDIAARAAAAGVAFRVRSAGEVPDARTGIYIADTIGELGLIYRIAPIVFMGGSLIEHGGQNPIEAIKLGAAVVHGPHVWNFSDVYTALDAGRGAEEIADARRLTACIGAWLNDPAARLRAASTAHAIVDRLGGALERTISALEPYFMQMHVSHRTAHA